MSRGGAFADKVVVVTGGGRGLGRQLVEAYAVEGADVVVASRKSDVCELVAEELRTRHGVRSSAVACDVGDWSQCDNLIETVDAEYGRIDVLVNNAGSSPLYPSLDQVSEALFDKVVGVNLKGPFRLSALAGARMAVEAGGAILNITSMAAVRPDPVALPYAAAKAGLNVLTEGMAQAFGPTVRVNAIQCGAFLTDISTAWDDATRDMLANAVALRRCGDPAEITGAALYLTGPASSFCTGTVLRLDGGMR